MKLKLYLKESGRKGAINRLESTFEGDSIVLNLARKTIEGESDFIAKMGYLNSISLPSIQPQFRTCHGCQCELPIGDFYSKGARTDSRCKSCILKGKQRSYRRRRLAVSKSKIVKKNSKVLTFGADQIIEIRTTSAHLNQSHLENLLRQFTFDSICRYRGNNVKK